MATGGRLSRTLEGGHEPFYDFPCSLCEKEGKHIEATKYCRECFVFMCDSCVQKKHNQFPLNTRHQMLDQTKFTSSAVQPTLSSFPTRRCLKHPGELINIYCGNHDVICCSVCKAIDHALCDKIQHLPDAAKGIRRSEDFQNIQKETQKNISDLEKVLNDQRTKKSCIAKDKRQVIQTIAEFRQRVEKYFDDLEKKSLEELDRKEKKIARDIDEGIQDLETAKAETENTLKKLETFRGDNECELFVIVKEAEELTKETQKKLHSKIRTKQKHYIQFNVDPEIETYLRSLTGLGIITNVSEVSPSTPTASVAIAVDSVRKYVQTPFGRFGIRGKNDRGICRIADICQLPDGKILLADDNNKSIKRLDGSYKLLDSITLPVSPKAICIGEPGEAAVSLMISKKIQCISTGKEMNLTKSFKVGNYCIGVLYHDGNYYVCCGELGNSSPGCIEVYDNTGQLERSIPYAPQGIAEIPVRLRITDDDRHLIVVSYKSDNVAVLDISGNAVSMYSHEHLNSPWGLCTDGKGHVFVSGVNSNTIVQLFPKTKTVEVILAKKDDIDKPNGICFDRKQSKLLVATSGSNDLLVFTLK